MGLNMKERQAVPDEFTRLTSYHRKSTVRLPDTKAASYEYH